MLICLILAVDISRSVRVDLSPEEVAVRCRWSGLRLPAATRLERRPDGRRPAETDEHGSESCERHKGAERSE